MSDTTDNKELFQALLKFRASCPKITKDSVNPHFKSNFASLEAIHDVIDPLLAENGLMVMQFPVGIGTSAGCKTIVIHESGQSLSQDFFVPVGDKPTAQKACAAVSYARRYGISGALGLVTEDDDDGNAASGKPAAATRNTYPVKGKKRITKSESEKIDIIENTLVTFLEGETDVKALERYWIDNKKELKWVEDKSKERFETILEQFKKRKSEL